MNIKTRHAGLAALASFSTPGLGHLYNGKPSRAMLFYLLSLAVYPVLGTSLLSRSFAALTAFMLLVLAYVLAVMVDAMRDARRVGAIELRPYNKWYVYLMVVLVNGLLISPILKGVVFEPSIRAFKFPSGSMLPTLEVGDHLVSDLRAYEALGPSRGDIVIFKFPQQENVLFIKRVIGLPGEEVELRGTQVFIDGAALDDQWGSYDPSPGRKSDDYGPTRIGADEYFLLGDNRDNSYDSRYWGMVRRSKIIGQARYLYWAKDLARIGKRLY